jgi:hypothetical protein
MNLQGFLEKKIVSNTTDVDATLLTDADMEIVLVSITEAIPFISIPDCMLGHNVLWGKGPFPADIRSLSPIIRQKCIAIWLYFIFFIGFDNIMLLEDCPTLFPDDDNDTMYWSRNNNGQYYLLSTAFQKIALKILEGYQNSPEPLKPEHIKLCEELIHKTFTDKTTPFKIKPNNFFPALEHELWPVLFPNVPVPLVTTTEITQYNEYLQRFKNYPKAALEFYNRITCPTEHVD